MSTFRQRSLRQCGQTLAPFKSKQLEGGVKVDWGTITTTAAYFEIARPSLITLNPGLPTATQAYDGEQNNHGIELNAYGLVMPGVRGMVSYTYPHSGDHQDGEHSRIARHARQGRRRPAARRSRPALTGIFRVLTVSPSTAA